MSHILVFKAVCIVPQYCLGFSRCWRTVIVLILLFKKSLKQKHGFGFKDLTGVKMAITEKTEMESLDQI